MFKQITWHLPRDVHCWFVLPAPSYFWRWWSRAAPGSEVETAGWTTLAESWGGQVAWGKVSPPPGGPYQAQSQEEGWWGVFRIPRHQDSEYEMSKEKTKEKIRDYFCAKFGHSWSWNLEIMKFLILLKRTITVNNWKHLISELWNICWRRDMNTYLILVQVNVYSDSHHYIFH